MTVGQYISLRTHFCHIAELAFEFSSIRDESMSVATIDRTTVFEKTARGRTEIGSRMAGLGAVYRQVLIVIDGRKNIEAMTALFPGSDIAGVATTLWREGFIDLVPGTNRAAVEAPPPRPAAHTPVHGVHSDLLGQAKDVMATSAKACIGLLADKLIVRIEGAHTLDELADVAGQWHMAMRESKRGRPVADELLDSVRRLLNQGTSALIA
jgi:hypothetical protein